MKTLRFLILSLVLAWQSCSGSQAAPVKCLELKGFGYPSDTADLYVSSAGVKSGGRNGWLLWTNKNVSTFMIMNAENKTYLAQPLNKRWSDGETTEHHRHRGRVTSVKNEGPSTICGLKCTKYSATCETREDSDEGTVCMEFWTCTTMPCSKAACDAWSEALGIPPGYGMPVRLRRHFRGTLMTVMDTKSVRTVAEPAEFFVIGSDYHRAADRAGLMFSKDGVLKPGDLDDLFISKDKSAKP